MINHLLASDKVLNYAIEEKSMGMLEQIPHIDLSTEHLEKYSLLEILLYLTTIDEVIEMKKDNLSKRFFELDHEDLVCKKLLIHTLTLTLKQAG